MKIEATFREPGTMVCRTVEPTPGMTSIVYEHTIAGLQVAGQWTVDLGPLTLVASGSDLLALAEAIRARLRGAG